MCLYFCTICSIQAHTTWKPPHKVLFLMDLGEASPKEFEQLSTLKTLQAHGLTFTQAYPSSANLTQAKRGLLEGAYPFRPSSKSLAPYQESHSFQFTASPSSPFQQHPLKGNWQESLAKLPRYGEEPLFVLIDLSHQPVLSLEQQKQMLNQCLQTLQHFGHASQTWFSLSSLSPLAHQTQVPWIHYWPDQIRGGTQYTGLISHLDLFATYLDMQEHAELGQHGPDSLSFLSILLESPKAPTRPNLHLDPLSPQAISIPPNTPKPLLRLSSRSTSPLLLGPPHEHEP